MKNICDSRLFRSDIKHIIANLNYLSSWEIGEFIKKCLWRELNKQERSKRSFRPKIKSEERCGW
jgi:hypothetical protein